MILKVNKDSCEIKENEIWNVGDYNVHTVNVELSSDFNGLVNKVRYFVEDNCYDELIVNNIAQVPYEATLTEGTIKIGVYGYDADTDILVQSTTPVNKFITSGTYTGEADNTEPLTPTDKQQMESAIQQNTDDIIVLQNNKQDVLISGENIKTINNESILGSGNIEIGGGSGETSNYNALTNKPKINNVELNGNKSLNDLGIQPAGNYALESEIPDVSNFITNSVNNLLNYYLKSETYTKQEVNNLIGQIATLQFQVVSTLPQTGDSKYIYLIPSSNPKTQNVKDEYIWANNAWEQIGSTQVDLTGYATESWVNTQISEFLTQTQIQALINTALSDYALESDIPTKTSELTNDSGFITGYAETDPTVPSHVKNITQANITSWNNKSDFSGNYNDLSNKPTIPTVPTKVSAFTNDVGYLTEHQDISGKVDKETGKGLSTNDFTTTYKNNVDSNTTARHTHSNKSVLDDISSTDITNWNNKSDFSGSYNDLSNKPAIPVKDNYTITNNLNNQLQTVGIIEQNVGNIIKYWEGTQSEYNAISSKDNNTIYYITDAEESYVIDNSYVHTDNNYTTTEKNKLSGIASGAEVNVQANWNETNSSSDAYIQNKPTIPTVNNSTITIQMNGSTVDNFTTNASSGKTINLGTVITSHQDISGKLNTSKVKNANSTTAGDVYDVRYINTMIGDVETILTTLTTGSGV